MILLNMLEYVEIMKMFAYSMAYHYLAPQLASRLSPPQNLKDVDARLPLASFQCPLVSFHLRRAPKNIESRNGLLSFKIKLSAARRSGGLYLCKLTYLKVVVPLPKFTPVYLVMPA